MTTEREALEAARERLYATADYYDMEIADAKRVHKLHRIPFFEEERAKHAAALAKIKAALAAPAIPQYHTTQSLAVEQDRAAREAPISQREAYQRGYAEGARSSVPSGWIACGERMPELHQRVAMLNADAWENTPEGRPEQNLTKVGCLEDGGYTRYWSVCGERAISLEAFTHWMPLPPPPTQDTPGEGS
ncbi:MAG: DUF551 domain-containing protein [Rhodospirillales bacterium]|nr:DUF551 domain-containing protein [Rhodospirillales bacterium]